MDMQYLLSSDFPASKEYHQQRVDALKARIQMAMGNAGSDDEDD